MLTSYVVKCPHEGCTWRGSLIGRDQVHPWSLRSASPREVVFHCPKCRSDFEGRVRGEDVDVVQPARKVA